MDFDDFVVYMFLYVGLARRRQKMSSPDKEKMDKRTQEFLDFVFSDEKKAKKMKKVCANGRAYRVENAFNNLMSYGNLSFYKFKNGRLNVSLMSRVSGLSRAYLTKRLWQKGLI